MTDEAAQQLAEACRTAMYARDAGAQKLEIEIQSVAPGTSVAVMPVREDMVNGHGICHGGYIFTLADTAFAYACNSYDHATVAQHCAIEFIAPGHIGDVLTATAEEQVVSGRNGLYDVTVRRQDGELIACFRGRSFRLQAHIINQNS